MTMSRNGKRRGFTLVELLVVVAIVAVLAALLFPALARAKARGQSTACLNNVRQLGTGLQTFLSDHHYYPINKRNNTTPRSHADSKRFWTGKLASEAFGNSKPTAGLFEGGIWQCPSARWSDSMQRGAEDNASVLLGYGYNDDKFERDMFGLQGHYDSAQDSYAPVRESEVVAPSQMMAIADGFEGNGMLRRRPIAVYEQWGNILTRHDRKANVGFCDGHVELLTLESVFEDTTDAALSRWNRDSQPHR